MIAPIYDPTDWYWVVNGDTSRVYSSRLGDYVPLTDTTYAAWVASGGVAPAIPSERELGVRLSDVAARPVAPNVLGGYLDAQVDGVVIKKLFKIIFNMNNRLRALEGQSPLTVAQARNAFRNML